ncbi:MULTISPECIES: hypothetical protein [Metabacillus]|uniref:hypothetical protein n=1 Tax=Metabacillus TaxID=2675233 RepID=UPI000C804A9C|nr:MULTISPECIES: hypothetical protein [Metabacillus]MCM3443348.1 hypothetical protein [Metabacillus halosaccharovorans]PMC34639.1 hypothetical protein CJ195_22795 [Bacillus sp. UMB0899]
MKKEFVNYKSDDTIIIKRSPVLSAKTKATRMTGGIKVSPASSVLNGTVRSNFKAGKSLRNSISENINSLDKVLVESNKILPYRKKVKVVGTN